MVFEKKKVGLETLSEYLYQIRVKLGLSVAEIADKTGIKSKFLESLEQGNFGALPADVYVLGFLRQLAQFYNLDSDDLIAQYRKERSIHEQLKAFSYAQESKAKRYLKGLVITPKIISLGLGALFVLATFIYLVWQVWSINQTPTLDISSPKDRQVIYGLTLEVAGRTEAGMLVKINDQDVFVDDKGNFKTQLGLTVGPKDIVIVAQNKFGKTTTKTISVIGAGQQTASTTAVTLKLNFTSDVTVTYSVDDSASQTQTFSAGSSQTLQGTTKVILSTDNAGAIRAVLNGQDLGTLGRSQESLKGVTFGPGFGTINSGETIK